MRKVIIFMFIFSQIVGVIYTRFSDINYFGWVPFDEISFYHIKVTVNSKELNSEQISNRYRLPNRGRENRSIHHVFSIISQYEQSYGKLDSAQVKVLYHVNGKEEEIWELCQ